VEAMSSGLPCVIANGGGSRSFIVDGLNGFLCEPNNADDYLDKINRLLCDEKLRRQFRMNGLAFVKDLSWDKLVSRLFQDWESMVFERDHQLIAS
jgi:glycosyltransferase involved in cell wall biosynthesis